MKKYFLLIIIFLTISIYSYSQSELRQGYLLLLNGDTIYGQIDNQNYYNNSVECLFKKNNTDSIIRYIPTQLKGYRFKDGKYYISMKIPANNSFENVFLEYLVNGQLNVFFRQDQNGSNHYFISKDTLQIRELINSKEIVEIEGKKYVNEKKEANGLLTYYMSDCASIIEEAQNFKGLNHKNLIQIGEKYHNLVCNDHKCVIYEKEARRNIKVGLLSGSSIIFAGSENVSKRPELSGGINFLFQQLQNSERFYIGIGILFDGKIDNNYLVSIPISLNYIYSNKMFSPYASISIDLNKFSPATSLNVGVQYKLKFVSFLLLGELKTIEFLKPYAAALRFCFMFDLKK